MLRSEENMPQDSLKSVVYRSFVTCDDPKGVVQCGTIRKSKTGSRKMKHKAEGQQARNEYHRSLASMIEREDVSSERSSSLQLLEVSRGAEKLNRMISSWSDGQSGDVAKDLLKGALDLQESLVMLGKLQEASKSMAQSRPDRFMSQRQNQNRYGGFGTYRVSVDGPSRDCIDQLREVIRESFAKQNILPPDTRTDKKAYFHQRSFGSDLEAPSTSSSQSSTDRSNTNMFCSTVKRSCEKAKGPSLIARLMGLEEIPSKPILNMAMKPQMEIQETARLKQVLKGDSPKEFNFREARSKCRIVDDIAPIVLIKPMHSGSQDFEFLEPTSYDDEPLKTELFVRQLKMKSEHSANVGNYRENSLYGKMLRKGDTEETVLRRPDRETGKNLKEEVKKHVEFEMTTKGRVSNKLKVYQNQQKSEAIDKRVDKVQKVSSTSRKPVEKETHNVKSPSSISQDQARVIKNRLGISENGSKIVNQEKRNATTPNLISKNAKQPIVHSSIRRSKNQAEKEKAKKKTQTTTVNVTCLKDKKISPTTEHDLAERETISKEEETDASELHSTEKETIATFIDHLIAEDETCTSELHLDEFGTIATFADRLIGQEETDASELQIEEYCIGSASSLCSTRMLNPGNDGDGKSAAQVLDNEGQESITDHTSFTTRTKLKTFLLGSPSFIRLVEDLFDLNINFPALPVNDLRLACAELSVDCANELVKRRSLPDSKNIHPLLLTCTGNTRVSVSLDQLMEDVCGGIETLRSYTHIGGKSLGFNMYATLESDLSSNGAMNGTWDFGWRHGFSMDEAELVVNDVEKLFLSQLIKEALA